MKSWTFLVVVASCLALAAATPAPGQPLPGEPAWRSLDPGLDLVELDAPRKSLLGDSRFTVVRIDPAHFELGLYARAALKLPDALPIDAWAQRSQLVAAINAGMYTPEGNTVGYARIGETVLNPVWKANYGAVLAIGPDNPVLPPVTILDSECDDVRATARHYRVVLQSMRMIDCKGANRWQKSARAWSTAALAIDDRGRVLFIHARSPFDVHDFNEMLIAFPLHVRRAMYLEGGPEASLWVGSGGVSLMRLGSFETSFNENDQNAHPWPLPNVIGARRRDLGAR